MEFQVGDESVCENCERPIFYGPSTPTEIDKKYKKYHNIKHDTWRHSHSQNHSCDRTVAIPKQLDESFVRTLLKKG